MKRIVNLRIFNSQNTEKQTINIHITKINMMCFT
jgi:hypothetical protein